MALYLIALAIQSLLVHTFAKYVSEWAAAVQALPLWHVSLVLVAQCRQTLPGVIPDSTAISDAISGIFQNLEMFPAKRRRQIHNTGVADLQKEEPHPLLRVIAGPTDQAVSRTSPNPKVCPARRRTQMNHMDPDGHQEGRPHPPPLHRP